MCRQDSVFLGFHDACQDLGFEFAEFEYTSGLGNVLSPADVESPAEDFDMYAALDTLITRTADGFVQTLHSSLSDSPETEARDVAFGVALMQECEPQNDFLAVLACTILFDSVFKSPSRSDDRPCWHLHQSTFFNNCAHRMT